MITPDRESCCGVMSRPSSLNDKLGVRAHDEHLGSLCALGRSGAGCDTVGDLVQDLDGAVRNCGGDGGSIGHWRVPYRLLWLCAGRLGREYAVDHFPGRNWG